MMRVQEAMTPVGWSARTAYTPSVQLQNTVSELQLSVASAGPLCLVGFRQVVNLSDDTREGESPSPSNRLEWRRKFGRVACLPTRSLWVAGVGRAECKDGDYRSATHVSTHVWRVFDAAGLCIHTGCTPKCRIVLR